MIKRWFEFTSTAAEKVAAPPPPPEVERPRAVAAAPAPVNPPRFGILKVVEMVNSQHLSGLSPDAKRCAVMMALETVGVGIEELLQDAVLLQRSLADEESQRQEKLRQFEEIKTGENAKLQAELATVTNQFMTQMQANLDEVAQEQDKFRAWQRKKQQESQQIAEAAGVCVPEGAGSHGGSLTAVLERACAARR
jgi:hypothetical protein